MKLQVQKLPKNLKGELLIYVDYDQNEDGSCNKSFTKGVPQGMEFDVPDEIGGQILAKYPKYVKLAGAAAAGAPKNKMAEPPGKTA